MSEVQRSHDARAVLRLLFNFLRLEMRQLRRHHRSHDFKQSAKELGRSQAPDSDDSLEQFDSFRCWSTLSIATDGRHEPHACLVAHVLGY